MSLKDTFKSFFAPVREDEEDASTFREAIQKVLDNHSPEEDTVEGVEKRLVEKLLEVQEMTAGDVCIPRADIVAASTDTSFEDLLDAFAKSGFARLPVYKDSLDDILGYIHIRDLLMHASNLEGLNLKKQVRDILFIPPSMLLVDVLNRMRCNRIPMAIVVDEYGGVDGLLTAWNIVREILGETDDLFRTDAKRKILERPDGSILVSARMDIEEFEESFGAFMTEEEREEEDIETIGGLAVYLAGRVPARKEFIQHSSGVTFEIMEADPRRVIRLRVFRDEQSQEG
ncbi:MAG: CBS domain-containing protein [Alphaproteobacteria bacterium]